MNIVTRKMSCKVVCESAWMSQYDRFELLWAYSESHIFTVWNKWQWLLLVSFWFLHLGLFEMKCRVCAIAFGYLFYFYCFVCYYLILFAWKKRDLGLNFIFRMVFFPYSICLSHWGSVTELCEAVIKRHEMQKKTQKWSQFDFQLAI